MFFTLIKVSSSGMASVLQKKSRVFLKSEDGAFKWPCEPDQTPFRTTARIFSQNVVEVIDRWQ